MGDAFKGGNRQVACVWFGGQECLPPLVVKAGHLGRVSRPSFRGRYFFQASPFPQAASPSKSFQSAFCAHARSSQKNNVLHLVSLRLRFVQNNLPCRFFPFTRIYLCFMQDDRHFIIYDLEATCWRSRRPRKVEVIEIGAVKVDENLNIIDEFCSFVKPKLHPEVSDFCTQLTSITQADVDRADRFDDVILDFEDWMRPREVRAVLMSWGEFDKRQLHNDAQLHNMELPWLRYHACLQQHYSRWKGSKNQIGLKTALELEGLSYAGTQHRAIEDARNMARLFQTVAHPMSLVDP